MLSDGPSKGGVDEIPLWKPQGNAKEVEPNIIASTAWCQEICTFSYFMKFTTGSLLTSEEIKDKDQVGRARLFKGDHVPLT